MHHFNPAVARRHPVVDELVATLTDSDDRYRGHEKLAPLVKNLSHDRNFLHEVLRGCLSDPSFLQRADSLYFPLAQQGDICININLFVPLRDGAKDITHDVIHHHGWRLLTTSILSDDGYEAIEFVRRSHENRTGDRVNLEIHEIYRHVDGKVRFIDSHTAHVVFHPPSVSATLAIWSADQRLLNQDVKRRLARFPRFRSLAVNAIHTLRLNNVLGLNPLEGRNFHPEGGRIVETPNYQKFVDGDREEIVRSMFNFFQQVGFTDADFFRGLKKFAPPEATPMIDSLISGKPIPELGIWGNPRRRFSKTQILQAIDQSHGGGVEAISETITPTKEPSRPASQWSIGRKDFAM